MRIRLSVRAALTAVLMTTLAVSLATSLSACGQRGALYIPGKSGDPYFDRQHRGTNGTIPSPVTAPNSTSPSLPGSVPGPPPDPRPKREDGANS